MKPVTRLSLPLLVLLGLCCGRSAWGLEAVSLQLKWEHQFQFAGYYAAHFMGFYEAAGLDVTIVEGGPDVNIIERVADPEIQFGTGNSDIVLAHAAGSSVRVLAVIMQHSPYVLVTRHDDGFASIHDIAGKRLMIEPHAAELIGYLSREGVQPEDYHSLPYTALQQFIDGDVDAISAYLTDELYLLEKQGIPFNTYYPATSGVDFYGDNLFTTQAEVEANPDRVRRFREASLRGWQYAMAHPDIVIDYIVATYPHRHQRGQLRFEANKMRQLMYPDLIAIGYMLPGRWQHMVDTYKQLGLLQPSYKLGNLLYQPQQSNGISKRLLIAWAASLLVLFVIAAFAIHLHRLNQRLLALVQYKNLLSNLGESISSISHQWKQPLHELGIQLMRIQQLTQSDSDASQSDRRQQVDQVVEKGNEILEFMAETVDAFGEVMGNRQQLITFSPGAAVQDLLRIYEESVREDQLLLVLDLALDRDLYGNPATFIQAVMNVIWNARDVLRERAIAQPQIAIRSSVDESFYRLTISDNGGGVSRSELKRLFQVGFSAKSQKGSGLGLYIARKLVREQFNGKLKVKQSPEGLSFTFFFPLPT